MLYNFKFYYCNVILPRVYNDLPCGTKFLREFIFADFWFFVSCGKEFLIFSFLRSTCNRKLKYIFSNNKPVFHRIPFCFWMKETSCDWTDTISYSIFVYRIYKLENIYFGVNFGGKNVCGKFYLRELIFVDRWKNRKNRKHYNPQKFVTHGMYVYGTQSN